MSTTIGLVLLATLISLSFSSISHYTKQQIQQKIGGTKIMYGATIRIRAAYFPYNLHSHNVNYPRGSGQQSVTGFPSQNDYNSLWTIKQGNRQSVKTYYHELKCGDIIRLQHALSKRNLHSQEIYQSMVTQGQQVSAFGSGGEGDENDNWQVKCVSKPEGAPFYGGDVFELVHVNTDMRMRMARYSEYHYNNWENCPFQSQVEVSGVSQSSKETQFKIGGGIFFKDEQAGSIQKETHEQSEEL